MPRRSSIRFAMTPSPRPYWEYTRLSLGPSLWPSTHRTYPSHHAFSSFLSTGDRGGAAYPPGKAGTRPGLTSLAHSAHTPARYPWACRNNRALVMVVTQGMCRAFQETPMALKRRYRARLRGAVSVGGAWLAHKSRETANSSNSVEGGGVGVGVGVGFRVWRAREDEQNPNHKLLCKSIPLSATTLRRKHS
jgi:hypothetical protein